MARCGRGSASPNDVQQRVNVVAAWSDSFLDFCRVEKGLTPNSIAAYRQDLRRFAEFCAGRDPLRRRDTAFAYVDSLRAAELSSRSIARHITTLRNLYSFLIQRGENLDRSDRDDGAAAPVEDAA